MVAEGVTFAAEAATDLGPYTQILNYGILGLTALALFQGRLVPAKLYEQALADRDREHGELVALRTKVEDQILPALVLSNEVMARLARRGNDAPLA